MSRFLTVQPLGSGEQLVGFDCGEASLNTWLTEHARTGGGIGTARSFVIVDREQRRVVGYHALAASSIRREQLPPELRAKLPRYPVPAILLCRLAVDVSVQGVGLGGVLVADAMQRALAAASVIGAHLLLVHALDERAAAFYRQYGLRSLGLDPLTLQIPLSEIDANLQPPGS